MFGPFETKMPSVMAVTRAEKYKKKDLYCFVPVELRENYLLLIFHAAVGLLLLS